MKGRVYEKYANDILESSFILNLCLFLIITFYLKAGSTPKYPIYVSNVSVGIVLLTFIGIIAFHVVLHLRSTFLWENGIKPLVQRVLGKNNVDITKGKHDLDEGPTSSVVTIELHEPLLESSHVSNE